MPSMIFDEFFKELGSIYKVKVPGKQRWYSNVRVHVHV